MNRMFNFINDNSNSCRVCVVGLGYVGLSNAILLAQHNHVVALDIVQNRIELVNSRISPIEDIDISKYLSEKN